jgi:hypothetical protein
MPPDIGGKAIGAMALLWLSIVEAGGVHALAASLALTAADMDFYGDAFADSEFVDIGSERGNRTHIFMAGRKILVEGQAAANACRRTAVDDLQIGGADRNRVDAVQTADR